MIEEEYAAEVLAAPLPAYAREWIGATPVRQWLLDFSAREQNPPFDPE